MSRRKQVACGQNRHVRLLHFAPATLVLPFPLMNVAAAGILPGPVPVSFEIKSAQLPLVALYLKTDQLDVLARDLADHFGADGVSPDFFDQDAVVLDFSALGAADGASLDLAALLALLRRYRLVPVAARAGSPALMQAVLALGLAPAPEEARRAPRRREESVPTPAPEVRVEVREVLREVEVAAPAALVITKPLRSGQKAYARGGDLVVLAMVNQGAEVVADGNIHVYAPLRGKALAGARGDTSARIFALCMEPELVSIAGIYRTSELPLPPHVLGQPAQIRLAGADADKLIIEPLQA
jgi:septum site-determining protein MinC